MSALVCSRCGSAAPWDNAKHSYICPTHGPTSVVSPAIRTSMDPEIDDAPPAPAPRDPATLDMFEAPAPAAQDDSSGDAARVLGGTV